MGRKYLEDIGVKDTVYNTPTNKSDKRNPIWAEEREIYGFDERETWNLDHTFYCWLYERLKMYLEKADGVIDLDFHKFEYEGEELTQRQCIERMIEGCKVYFSDEYENGFPEDETLHKKVMDVTKIWALVIGAMWW